MNYQEGIISKNIQIRHQLDEKSGEFYFSIVDIIDNLGLSTDPRNYWKVLKSRLKNTQKELVTNCNQLKMASSDGKYYLTDVATAPTILGIIQIISPTKVATFSVFFDQIEKEKSSKNGQNPITEDEISTVSYDEAEIQVDIVLGKNYLLVKAMLAGVNPRNIFISANNKTLTIKGSRLREENIPENNFHHQELFWGKFQRVIDLPHEVDIDNIEASLDHGLLTIKLPILDKTRTKIIKVNPSVRI